MLYLAYLLHIYFENFYISENILILYINYNNFNIIKILISEKIQQICLIFQKYLYCNYNTIL